MSSGEIISIVVNALICITMITALALSNRKQRNEVTFGFTPASKDDFDKHIEWNRREHENLFSKIGGVERGAQMKLEKAIQSGNVSREKLHGRINECDQTMGELRGKMEILINKL